MKHTPLYTVVVCLAAFVAIGCQDDARTVLNETDTGPGPEKPTDPGDIGDDVIEDTEVDTQPPAKFLPKEDTDARLCDGTDDPCCVGGELECWLDEKTGLYWQVTGTNDYWLDASGGDSQSKPISAVEYCANIRLGGFEGWRVPDFNELRSIVEGCDQLGDCDRSDNNCVNIHDDECLEYPVCSRSDPDDPRSKIGSGGNWTNCYKRPFYRPYLPAPFWESARNIGNGYWVWSTSTVWTKPYNAQEEAEAQPSASQVYVMAFQVGFPQPKTKFYVQHPAIPPVPAVTHCVYDPSEE